MTGNEWRRQWWKLKSLKEEEKFKDPKAWVLEKSSSQNHQECVLVGMRVTRNLNLQVQEGLRYVQICEEK